MALHTFAYTPYPIPASNPFPNGQTAYRPMLRVRLHVAATGATFSCLGWPDSGADHCVFPLSFAASIGLDPLLMPSHNTGGVGALNLTYYHVITVQIPILNADGSITTITFDTNAGFTTGMEAQGIGLLGQLGFFENFRVMFDHGARLFYVDDTPPAPQPAPAAP